MAGEINLYSQTVISLFRFTDIIIYE